MSTNTFTSIIKSGYQALSVCVISSAITLGLTVGVVSAQDQTPAAVQDAANPSLAKKNEEETAQELALDALPSDELRNVMSIKIRTIQHMALHPVVIQAVKAQNAQNLKPADIKARDERWVKSPRDSALKRQLSSNDAAQYLKKKVGKGIKFNEAFVTDNQGANVAVFPVTTDYNQGDERKWRGAFNNGEGKIYIGKPDRDPSTGVDSIQVSAPVVDRGKTIGVLIVGVPIDHLESMTQ